MVDMFMEVEQARSMTLMGDTQARSARRPNARPRICLPRRKVASAVNFVGQNAIQTHGGIGITHELAIGHYFKRATMIESQFGSADYHLDRFEQLTLDAQEDPPERQL